jgi:hypothetical protein
MVAPARAVDPTFAKLYKLLCWTAGFPFSSYTYPSRRPSSPIFCAEIRPAGLAPKSRFEPKVALLNQKSSSAKSSKTAF